MGKALIIERLRTMKTANELVELLNLINQDSCELMSYTISESKLRFYALDSVKPFKTFYIPKKDGNLRRIKAPCKGLKHILATLNLMLNAIYKPSDASMGFTAGRSILNNAEVHKGHNYIFNIDLRDFFSSIPQARVWKRLQLPPFDFTQEIASIIAGLCCTYDETVDANVLPQGSPVSPLITNAICDNLDRKLTGVAKRFGLNYTRYADDITFSSMHNVYHKNGAFYAEINRIITAQGFRINESKTRLQIRGSRQVVTGLKVNTAVNVSNRYMSNLRWILNVWEREGYDKACYLFFHRYDKENTTVKKFEPNLENVIDGKLNYLKMIRGKKDSTYIKLKTRFNVLIQKQCTNKKSNNKITYMNNSYVDQSASETVMLSKVEDVESDDFTAPFRKAMESFLTEYEKILVVKEINGKKLVSLKDLLEICNNSFNFNNSGDIAALYQVLKNYLTSPEGQAKYIITDLNEGNNILNDVGKTQEQRDNEELGTQEAEVDIRSLIAMAEHNMNKAEFYKTLNSIKVGDKIIMSVQPDGEILFSKNSIIIGRMKKATVIGDRFEQTNLGIVTDVKLDANGLPVSNTMNTILDLFLGDTQAHKDLQTLLETVSVLGDEVTDSAVLAFFSNPLIARLRTKAIAEHNHKQRNTLFLVEKETGDINGKNVLTHLVRLWKYTTKNKGFSIDETKSLINYNLSNWFIKLYNAYNRTQNLQGSQEVTVSRITQGGARLVTGNDTLSFYDSLNFATDGIADVNNAALAIVDGNSSPNGLISNRDSVIIKLANNSTLLALYDENGHVDFVKAIGVRFTDPKHTSKDALAIKKSLIEAT